MRKPFTPAPIEFENDASCIAWHLFFGACGLVAGLTFMYFFKTCF